MDNIGRYQRGEPLAARTEAVVVETPKLRTTLDAKAPTAVKQTPNTSQAKAKSPVRAATKQKTTSPVKATAKQPPSEKHSSTASKDPLSGAPSTRPPPAKSHPPRGKASFECGCYGRLHDPLTNCLFCGRVACAKEGYSYCPFCGYLIEEVKPSSSDKCVVVSRSQDRVVSCTHLLFCRVNEAWLHKERLLRYDREFAQRTMIFDDSVDHHSDQKSAWLDQDEAALAAQQEEERDNQMHRRQKMQLNLGGI